VTEPNLTPKQAADALRIGLEVMTVVDRLLRAGGGTATCAIDVVAGSGISRMLILISDDQGMVSTHENLCRAQEGDA